MTTEPDKIWQTSEYFVVQKFVNFEVHDKVIVLLLPCWNKVHVPQFVDIQTFTLKRKFAQ
jgi:hypothetical protein